MRSSSAHQRELIALAQLHAVEPLAQRADRAFELGGTARPLSINAAIRILELLRGRRRCCRRRHARTGRRARGPLAESCASAPSEATLETTPRSDTTACSSCLNAIGSWLLWAVAAMWSILPDKARTASSKPTRFSAGVSARNASRTSTRPCAQRAERGAVGAGLLGAVEPLCKRVRTSASSASMAWRGIASCNVRPTSARSLRSAMSAFS